MKPIIFTSVIILASVAGEAMAAAPCTGGAPANSASAANIALILAAGRYACGFQYDGKYFNETLSGGKVLDFRRGPASPTDPSETVATADGTFTINAASGGTPATITYTYGASSFTYSIKPNNSTAPGTYAFCQEAGPNAGQALNVTVQAGPCAVQP
jgi:hypothetical protein